jgi:uncharacterized membrane protein YeaQ/YmgE (transglycosylase-associated protein family)
LERANAERAFGSGRLYKAVYPRRWTSKGDRMPGIGRITGIAIMLLVGLVVGATAKLLVPGKDPGGIVTTSVLGVVGSLIGGWIGYQLGMQNGFALSVGGAVLILLGYRLLRRQDQRG